MQRIAKFGCVWQHKKTKKILGSSIDVESYDELGEYTQIPKPKEVKAKTEEKSKEKEIK